MSQELADFAEMDKAPEAQPGAARPRREDGKFAKVDRRPPEQPEGKAGAEVQKPEAEPGPKPGETVTPKSPMRVLGEKYETLQKQVETEYRPTIQRLESQVEELKKAAASPELAEQAKQWQARAEAAEKKLETVNFTQSQKYQNEYHKPYVDAWNRAVTQFRELAVRAQKGVDEFGQPVFEARPANETDLLRLANLPLSEMDEEVTKLFGASAPRVLQHIEKLKELATARRNAELQAEERAVEARKQEQASSEARVKNLASTWTEVNKSLEEKFPKAFKPEDGNAEDAAAHARGLALADLTFLGEAGLTPQQVENLPAVFKDTIKARQPLSEAQRVQLHALARLKILNHDRQVARVKKLTARVAELEKDLADYERSAPGGRPGAREAKPGEDKDWLATAEDELRALDK